MSSNYYGTVAGLAWILDHYFYNDKHHTWLAAEYYPYKLPNPKSSNPHLIYQDLYQPWRDKDDFDKVIQQTRLNLRKGVIAKWNDTVLSSAEADDLKDICDNINILFLYPIVYRVNIDKIDVARRKVSGSGLRGSSEYVIEDLDESEIKEIIFLDFDSDPDFKKLIVDERSGASRTAKADALTILTNRCPL